MKPKRENLYFSLGTSRTQIMQIQLLLCTQRLSNLHSIQILVVLRHNPHLRETTFVVQSSGIPHVAICMCAKVGLLGEFMTSSLDRVKLALTSSFVDQTDWLIFFIVLLLALMGTTPFGALFIFPPTLTVRIILPHFTSGLSWVPPYSIDDFSFR